MAERDLAVKLLEDGKKTSNNITGKKRKYEEALGYQNDYEVVQEPEKYITNNIEIKGHNWIDSYLENL
jgi:hypothetical protein